MQDYPEDGGKGMSQVFNGRKMLLDLPSPPAVQVNRTVYFTDELLQESSGGYFIPNRFFLAAGDTPADTTESCDKVLYALGRAAQRTEVCSHLCNMCLSSNVCQAGFIVSDEEEIIPTSMFTRSFGDIAATCGELDCGLTGTFGYTFISDYGTKTWHSIFHQVCVAFTQSAARKVERSNGVYRSLNHFYGRRFRQYLEAVEQASCYIHVQRKFASRDARKGILCAICFVLSSCSAHGIDAGNERIHLVCRST